MVHEERFPTERGPAMTTIDSMERRMQRGVSELRELVALAAPRPLDQGEERSARKIRMLIEETAAALQLARCAQLRTRR
jgi:hypothetical protein